MLLYSNQDFVLIDCPTIGVHRSITAVAAR